MEMQGRERADAWFGGVATKGVSPDVSLLVDTVNNHVHGVSLHLKVKQVCAKGRPARAVVLTTGRYVGLEASLWLGVLQRVLERRPILKCEWCGEYYEVKQLRGDRRFCNRSHKVAFARDANRRAGPRA